jgi:alpha-tubulin suppressor-like RCC1 family protein
MTPPSATALAIVAWSVCAGCDTNYDVLRAARRDIDAEVTDAAMAGESDGGNVSVVLDGRRMAAFEHTCVARSDGLYCWGSNTSGQLGLGDTAARDRPQRVPGLENIGEVCAGKEHTCALSGDGSLRCWGLNLSGQLGAGARASVLQPVSLDGTYLRVACGGNTTCAIDTSHHLVCWGDNFEGEAGINGAKTVFAPTRLALSQEFNNVSVGEGDACAVGALGSLWCWGRNSEGQLGIDSSLQQQVRTPTRIGTDQGFRVVSTAQQHTCATRGDYALWCWGVPVTGLGKLGAEPVDQPSFPTKVAVSSGLGVYDVSTNWFHSCVLHGAGTLACFGRNTEGQLGLGDTEDRSLPVDIEGQWDEVAAGRFHTCARRGDDTYCWGKNDDLQLGLGDTLRRDAPAQLRFD